MSDKIDVLDLVINLLKEHEKEFDRLVGRMELLTESFEATVDELALKKAREILRDTLEDLDV